MRVVAILQWCIQKVNKFSVLSQRLSVNIPSQTPTSSNGAQNSLELEKNSSGTGMNHFLIVGLGNHGYDGTRHNVGMRAADRLADRLQLAWGKSLDHSSGFLCSTTVGSGEKAFKLTLFKPKSLMNISGVSVAKTAKMLSIAAPNVFLVHDELDRSVGKYHLKEGGSAGGHNGVMSCMNSLRSNEMPRLRIGIGRPLSKSEVINYVLSKFSQEEIAIIDRTIDQAVHFLLEYIAKRVMGAGVEEFSKGRLGKHGCRKVSSGSSVSSENAALKLAAAGADTSRDEINPQAQSQVAVESEPCHGKHEVLIVHDKDLAKSAKCRIVESYISSDGNSDIGR